MSSSYVSVEKNHTVFIVITKAFYIFENIWRFSNERKKERMKERKKEREREGEEREKKERVRDYNLHRKLESFT